METLPSDIMKNINEFACMKKHNNISSKDFMIVLKTTHSINKQSENEIIAWLTKKLQSFILNDGNTIDLIYELIADDAENKIYNHLRILVHFSCSESRYSFDSDDIICIQEYPRSNSIHAKTILNQLNNEHKFINKIGVSGISEKLMKELWWEMIGEEIGFMNYPSYFMYNDEIMNRREKSFNFGWDNYPLIESQN